MSSFFEKYTHSIKSDLSKVGKVAAGAGTDAAEVAVDGFKKGVHGEIAMLALGVGSTMARKLLTRAAFIPPVAGALLVAGAGYLALKALKVHDEMSAELEARAETSAAIDEGDAC